MSAGGISVVTAKMLESLDQQIAAAEAAIKREERWETKLEVSTVIVVDPFTGEEREMEQRKTVSVPVGAESLRSELETLLARRRSLTKPW